jgi:hypothetical protein
MEFKILTSRFPQIDIRSIFSKTYLFLYYPKTTKYLSEVSRVPYVDLDGIISIVGRITVCEDTDLADVEVYRSRYTDIDESLANVKTVLL